MPHRSQRQLTIVEENLAAVGAIDAGDGAQEMTVPGSLNAGDADDPAGRSGEIRASKSPTGR